MKYNVLFEYTFPQFTNITVDAESGDEAETLANQIFLETYPEALDMEIIEIQNG